MSAIEEFFKTPKRREFGSRIEKIMSLIQGARKIEDPLQRKKEEGNFRRMLDKLYWELFEAICCDVLERDNVEFHQAELIILDYGLLDFQQIIPTEPDANSDSSQDQEPQETLDLDQIEKRIKKFYVKSSYDEDPIYYMHEWASMWQVNSELYAASNNVLHSEEEWLDDEKAKKYTQTRSNIYRKLHAYLEKLPGVNENFLKVIIAGDFDRKVELSKVKSKLHHDELEQSDKHFISLHSTLYSQLKASLKDSEDLKLVYLAEKINEAILQRRLKEVQLEHGFEESKFVSVEDKSEKMIQRELKLLKNLLPIGGMEGREFFTTPLLKEFNHPLNKVFVGDTMKLIRQCDPHIPEDLPVVIVPYKGSGFFEWDKNTLIVPVTPSLPPKEVIIRAVANYRILTDNLEHNGELKRQYERHLEKGGFKERFLHDYVQWIEHISKGHLKIMSVKKFDFFVEYVGPSRDKLLADGHLLYLSKYQLRKKIQEILTSAKMTQKEFYNLSVCYWLVEEYKKADQYMTEAMTAGMPSPKILLAQGYISLRLLEKAKARQMFKNCLRFFKNTLFGAYAARELDKV